MKEADVDVVLSKLREDHAKYKFMESKLMQTRRTFKVKIPDIKNCIEMVEHLIKAREEGTSVESQYPLSHSVYASATIDNPESVCLFLGANVMMEYSLDEALTLLTENLQGAETTLADLINDLAFLKDQITITEVNTARVYNYDVVRRRKAAAQGESLDQDTNIIEASS